MDPGAQEHPLEATPDEFPDHLFEQAEEAFRRFQEQAEGVQPGAHARQGLHGAALTIDSQHTGGAPGQCLDRKDTAPREQVQAACADEVGLQPVEKRLTNPVRGWAQPGNGRHRDAGSFPPPADDADAAFILAGQRL